MQQKTAGSFNGVPISIIFGFLSIKASVVFLHLYNFVALIIRFAWQCSLLVIVFTACVPNRKYTYVQKNDLHRKDIRKDSVLRTYSVDEYDYKIQPNDLLSIRFESLTPDEYNFFSMGKQSSNAMNSAAIMLNGDLVDENGEIPFPVVGKVKVAGLTVFQAQDKMQALAKEYLKDPVVKVRMLNFRYTVIGEVRSANTYTSQNNRVTLLEAIGSAGGLGDLADKSNVKILRQSGDSVVVAYVNVLNEDLVLSPYYYVHQNDVIVVPPLRQRPFRAYFGQNVSLFVSTLSLMVLVYNLVAN